MKIIGTKYEGLESSICYFDHDKEELFALQSDKSQELKDNLDIDQLLNYIKKKKLFRVISILFQYLSQILMVMMQC